MDATDEFHAQHMCGWGNGAFLPGMNVVGNHNPEFAPAIQPTLRTGTEAAIAATLAYLG